MFIPWQVDVPRDRWPVSNWLIIAGVTVVFAFQWTITRNRTDESQWDSHEEQLLEEQMQSEEPSETISAEERAELQEMLGEKIYGPIWQYFLRGWRIKGLFGHMWLHGDIFHFLGNMLFLWIFGNAVCAKIGNVIYLPIYLAFGLFAAVVHLIFVGGAMIGASGAINGVVGMYLVFFPENEITCFWSICVFYWKQFSVRSFWMILLWLTYDILGAVFLSSGRGGVAYFAHLGGFAVGFGLAILMLKTKKITMERYEKSLLELLAERRGTTEEKSNSAYASYLQREFRDTSTAGTKVAEMPGIGDAQQQVTNIFKDKPLVKDVLSVEDFFQEESIRLMCSCGKKMKVPVKYAGKTGKCPRCGSRVTIPGKSGSKRETISLTSEESKKEFIRFSCTCGKKLKMPVKYADKSGKCPSCKKQIQVPKK